MQAFEIVTWNGKRMRGSKVHVGITAVKMLCGYVGSERVTVCQTKDTVTCSTCVTLQLRKLLLVNKEASDKILQSAMHDAWNAIAADAISSYRSEGERFTNAHAYELILDADRLEEYGYGYRGVKDPLITAAFVALRKQPWKAQVATARRLLGNLV